MGKKIQTNNQNTHNIIHIQDIVMLDCDISPNISHIHTDCKEYPRIFLEILSLTQNIVIDLNIVMHTIH